MKFRIMKHSNQQFFLEERTSFLGWVGWSPVTQTRITYSEDIKEIKFFKSVTEAEEYLAWYTERIVTTPPILIKELHA